MVVDPARYGPIRTYIYGPIIEAYWQAIDSGAEPLTPAREFLDSLAGITPGSKSAGANIAEIRADIIEAQKRPLALSVGPVILDLQEGLGDALDFMLPQLGIPPDLFDLFADLLFDPPRVPGEPCRAAPPLLRDLLDMALGRGAAIIGQILGQVGSTVEDALLPAFGTAQDIADAVAAVLDDPITAAFNMILGQQAQIECETDASLGVGVGVIEEQIRRLEKELSEALA